jgi:hypothetical protein
MLSVRGVDRQKVVWVKLVVDALRGEGRGWVVVVVVNTVGL